MEKKVKYVFMIRALKTQKLCVTDIGIIAEKSKLKVKHEEIILCCFLKTVRVAAFVFKTLGSRLTLEIGKVSAFV